ncbi:tetratricopeptide repeat protein [Marinoscillum sp.]|uniref:tetratricopeptide repeat protein n=1 Tax=Marinoscillum sp. TaxID=2024838 RepID=UPI003BAB1529
MIFLIGLKFAVLIHEMGHLLFAQFVGGTPRRMILGKGHKVAETRFKGVKIILNSNFTSGLAYAAFDNLKLIRLRLLSYTSGGFLTNFFIASILFLAFDLSTDASDGIQFSSAIVFANLLTGISVLIPHYSSYQGLRLYSDGLSLLRIPFLKKSNLVELSSVNELLDAYDLFESKKYREAIAIYENFHAKTEGSKTANINLSIAHMKLGNYEKAVQLMEELLPLVDEERFAWLKNYIFNGIAWEYLLLNKLDEADKYSELAYKADQNTEHIRGTRASVLIEKGKYEEGKNLLINDVDFNFPNSQTLAASIYVGLAFHELNEHKKAEKYVNFVEDNLELLDIDEKTLYERSKKKWRNLTDAKNEYVN